MNAITRKMAVIAAAGIMMFAAAGCGKKETSAPASAPTTAESKADGKAPSKKVSKNIADYTDLKIDEKTEIVPEKLREETIEYVVYKFHTAAFADDNATMAKLASPRNLELLNYDDGFKKEKNILGNKYKLDFSKGLRIKPTVRGDTGDWDCVIYAYSEQKKEDKGSRLRIVIKNGEVKIGQEQEKTFQ